MGLFKPEALIPAAAAGVVVSAGATFISHMHSFTTQQHLPSQLPSAFSNQPTDVLFKADHIISNELPVGVTLGLLAATVIYILFASSGRSGAHA